jgi:hypothetical protein
MAEVNMKEYSEFVDKLHVEYKAFLFAPKATWHDKATRYVNGLAADEG